MSEPETSYCSFCGECIKGYVIKGKFAAICSHCIVASTETLVNELTKNLEDARQIIANGKIERMAQLAAEEEGKS